MLAVSDGENFKRKMIKKSTITMAEDMMQKIKFPGKHNDIKLNSENVTKHHQMYT